MEPTKEDVTPPAPPPHDPLAALRAAMDQLNAKVAGDLHDRLAAHDAMLRAIGNLILHPPGG